MHGFRSRTYQLQSTLHLIVSVGLVLVLAGLSIHYYLLPREKAHVVAHAASIDGARLAVHYYYALTGEWPEDKAQLQSFHDMPGLFQGHMKSDVYVEKGVLQLPLVSGAFSGTGELSLHPAVPAADPAGPVHWVVGAGMPASWRTVIGPDRSVVPDDYIIRDLR